MDYNTHKKIKASANRVSVASRHARMLSKHKWLIRLFTIVYFTYVHTSVYSQNGLYYNYNGFRVGDNVSKCQIEYLHAGDSGEDVTWDFSNIQQLEEIQAEFCCDSDSTVIFEFTQDRINKYSTNQNALLLLGTENPLERIYYNKPVTYMKYPFSYGESFITSYSGTGLYCMTHGIETSGDIDVEADAIGTLILSDEDIVSNVTRIHSIRSGAISIHLKNGSTSNAQSRTKQEIEERYQWYARGFRYPLIETVSTSYYDNMDLVSCIQKAYCSTPELQRTLLDLNNDSIKTNEFISKKTISDLFHYRIEIENSHVKLSYSLEKDASITIIVCNHRGMVYKRISLKMPTGYGYKQDIDCSGLSQDLYILYINVNGVIYSEKIEIK